MNKVSFGIAIGVALLALFLGVVILLQTTNTHLPIPIDTQPTPIPKSIIPALLPSTKENITTLSVVSAVTLTFNTQIVPSSLSYTISPAIPLEIRYNKTHTELSFLPKNFWQPKIPYTLTIKRLKNVTGLSLPKVYQVSFQADATNDDDEKEIINNPEVHNAP